MAMSADEEEMRHNSWCQTCFIFQQGYRIERSFNDIISCGG